MVVQIQATLQCTQEVISVIALEGKAQTALTVCVHRGNSVFQAAGGMDNGDSTVTHGVHLAQPARLALGGHQVDVTAGVDPGRKLQIKGDLGSDFIREFLGKLLKEMLEALFSAFHSSCRAI